MSVVNDDANVRLHSRAQQLTRSPLTRNTERSTSTQVGSMKITALKPRVLRSLRWWIRVSRNTLVIKTVIMNKKLMTESQLHSQREKLKCNTSSTSHQKRNYIQAGPFEHGRFCWKSHHALSKSQRLLKASWQKRKRQKSPEFNI